MFVTAEQSLLDLATQDSARALDRRLRHYGTRTSLLVSCELGYLSIAPIRTSSRSSAAGANLVLTTNLALGEWPAIFLNADSAIGVPPNTSGSPSPSTARFAPRRASPPAGQRHLGREATGWVLRRQHYAPIRARPHRQARHAAAVGQGTSTGSSRNGCALSPSHHQWPQRIIDIRKLRQRTRDQPVVMAIDCRSTIHSTIPSHSITSRRTTAPLRGQSSG